MEGMTLFIFHVIVVGILIAVTAFIAYNAGKNKGRFISEGQNNRNVEKIEKKLFTYVTPENLSILINSKSLKN